MEFVHQYDKVVAAHRTSESQQDFRGLNSVPNCTSNPYEIQVSKLYTPKIFQLFQKEWAVVTTLFSEELEHDGPGSKYLVGDFSELKDSWEKVSYEKPDELHVSCSLLIIRNRGYPL